MSNFRESERTTLSTLLYAYRKEWWWIGFERAVSELRICQDRSVNILSLIRRASREWCAPGDRSLHCVCCYTRSWKTGQVFAAVSRSNHTHTHTHIACRYRWKTCSVTCWFCCVSTVDYMWCHHFKSTGKRRARAEDSRFSLPEVLEMTNIFR